MTNQIPNHKMAYSGDYPAWYNLIKPAAGEGKTAMDILKEDYGGGFEVSLRPTTMLLNGEVTETGFGVVRGSSPFAPKEHRLAFCTKRYHPLQPWEVAQCFDNNVNRPVDAMGFLGHGGEMLISWKLPMVEVMKGDEVQLYGMVRGGFDTQTSYRLFTSAIRFYCWNCVTLMQGWANRNTDGKGKGNIWRGKAVSLNLLRDLGYWMKHVQSQAEQEAALVEGFFKRLASTPIKNDAEVHEILYYAYPPDSATSDYYPAQLVAEKDEKIAKANEAQEELRDGIYELFAGGGTAITPDYWGVFNATTEFFTQVQESKKPIAESVLFGGRANNTRKMVDVLSERMG